MVLAGTRLPRAGYGHGWAGSVCTPRAPGAPVWLLVPSKWAMENLLAVLTPCQELRKEPRPVITDPIATAALATAATTAATAAANRPRCRCCRRHRPAVDLSTPLCVRSGRRSDRCTSRQLAGLGSSGSSSSCAPVWPHHLRSSLAVC